MFADVYHIHVQFLSAQKGAMKLQGIKVKKKQRNKTQHSHEGITDCNIWCTLGIKEHFLLWHKDPVIKGVFFSKGVPNESEAVIDI